jgi:hypothetical protein
MTPAYRAQERDADNRLQGQPAAEIVLYWKGHVQPSPKTTRETIVPHAAKRLMASPPWHILSRQCT